MNISHHSLQVINTVRKETDRVILFYSCGKDSIAMLDMVAPHFKEVVCVYMYFVKGLNHIDRFVNYSKSKYQNVTFLEIPHWNLSRALKIGFFCQPQKDIRLLKPRDVIDRVRAKTGINWCFVGMKQADSLNRRLMLRTYEYEAINYKSQIAYPLSYWKKKEVISYIRFHNLPIPIEYSKEAGNGLWFDLKVYLWMKENEPGDLEKVLKAFPLSGKILFDYEQRTE